MKKPTRPTRSTRPGRPTRPSRPRRALAGLADDVEQRLREAQKNKQFKDAGERIAGSRKEKAALKMGVNSRDLATLEQSPETAALLVIKDKVFPPVDVAQERLDGAASGMVYLKTEIRKAFPPAPSKQYYTAEGRAAYVRLYEWVLQLLDQAGEAPRELPKLAYLAMQTGEFLDVVWPRSVLIAHYNDRLAGALRFGVDKADFLHLSPMPADTQLPGQEMDEAFRKRWYSTYNIRRFVDDAYGKRLWNVLLNQSPPAYQLYRAAAVYNAQDPQEAKQNYERALSSLQGNVVALEQQVHLFERSEKLSDFILFAHAYSDELKEALGIDLHAQHLNEARTAQLLPWLREKARQQLAREQHHQAREQARGAVPRPADWSWAEKKKKAEPGKGTPGPDGAPVDPNALDPELEGLRLNDNRPLAYIKRTGGLRIEQVSEAEIIRLFGFRAVEVGNYVRDVEAAEHLRHFLGAMADLYEILDLDAVQTTQLGSLSIAFGSRGQGGKAAAFYDPNYRIINLTKTCGDGTVAHEWLHYLDHVLYQQLAGFVEPKTPFFSAGYPDGRGQNVPHIKTTDFDVRKAVAAIFIFIRTGHYTDPATGRSTQLHPQGLEQTMRFVRQKDRRPIDRGRDTAFDPEAYPTPALAIAEIQREYPYLGQPGEQAKYFKRDAPYFYGYLAHVHDVAYLDVPIRTKSTTAFYHYSSRMKSAYWIEPWELLARSFERYVSDKLTAAGRTNNYLVAAENKFVGARGRLYPQGKEAEILVGLYDTLLAALKTALQLRPFVPFTTQRTDEYLVLDGKTATETVTTGVVAPALPPAPAAAPDVATRLRLAQAKAQALALRRRRETPPA